MNEIRYAELCSGVGGGRLAFQRVGGYRHVYSNDWDKDENDKKQGWWANRVYTKHFGKENHSTDDIRKVKAEDIPDHDLLCAGFPCQAFSTSGKRLGFEDTRGTIFFEIARIIKGKRPPILLLENVPGLLNHDYGYTFATILEVLGRFGYRLEWQVIRSNWVGVPQTRPRVFIIGHLTGPRGCTGPILPITEDDLPDPKTDRSRNGYISRTITAGNADGWNARSTYVVVPKHARTFTAGGHSGGLHKEMNVVMEINRVAYGESQQDRLYHINGLAPPVPACRAPDKLKIITPDKKVRRLTEIEVERLQGFPDNWTNGIAMSKRYEVLGNAFTVDVIELLARKIKESINSKSRGI